MTDLIADINSKYGLYRTILNSGDTIPLLRKLSQEPDQNFDMLLRYITSDRIISVEDYIQIRASEIESRAD
jgi:hypothetical protein